MARRPSFRLVRQIMVSASVIIGAPTLAASSSTFTSSPPPAFVELDAQRQLLIDLFLDGQKVGQTAVTILDGQVRFDEPVEVVSRIPNLVDRARIHEWLSQSLDGNFDRACGRLESENCGHVDADQLAIVIDEDRFRIDLFIPRAQFRSIADEPRYLPQPKTGVSFISRFGAAVTGGAGADGDYHFQNHSIFAAGNYRLRTDSSVLSRGGVALDNVSLERDLDGYRLLSGLFWVPGGDFLGRRKIMGAGVVSQIDTRLDRRALTSSPLSVSLAQSGRIDLFVEGRLVSSRVYSSGQIDLDTTPLPEGSYEVTIRIHEGGRNARQERRFFTKGVDIAPQGTPYLGAFAGMLADARGRPDFDVPFFNLSAAVRLASQLGVDARLFGTDAKVLGEIGTVVMTPLAKLRGSLLVSTAGDYGFLARATTGSRGPISISFDLRTVKSENGRPLLPESGSLGTYSEEFDSRSADRGSYTQGSIYAAAKVRQAFVRLTGLYRRSGGNKANYSISASVEQPVMTGSGWHIVANADVRKTDYDTAAFIGFRALLARPTFNVVATGGWQHQGGGSRRFVGETQASLSRPTSEFSDVSMSAALGRDASGAYGRAGGLLRTPAINLRGDMLHAFANNNLPHFSASLESALVYDGAQITIGAREVSDSAIIVRPRAEGGHQDVEVMVDDNVRGRASPREPLLLFLQPYELHRVRIRPVGGLTSNYDSSDTEVATHPGLVVALSWATVRTTTVFGQAIDHYGRPLAKARVETSQDIGLSDDEGYFQVEARPGERLAFKMTSGHSCTLAPIGDSGTEPYVDAGVQTCQ